MNIYFYDNLSSSFERLANKVVEEIIELNDDITVFYIHDNLDKTVIDLPGKLSHKVKVINPSSIQSVLRNNKPAAYICFSYRIPDVYWNMFFKSKGVPTFQIQHGIYIDYFERDIKSFLKSTKRNLLYAKYLLQLLLFAKNKIQTVKGLLKKDVQGIDKVYNVDKRIKSDHILIWGKYWENWFKSYLYYDDSTSFQVCGNFDFKLLNSPDLLINESEPSVTYITQTLVEDSRINVSHFNQFLTKLERVADSFTGKMYIKLHPRSNLDLYSRLKIKENVVLTKKFPITDYYIGHYSTLLSLPAYLNKTIILVELPNHPIPDIFKQLSNSIQFYDDNIELDKIHSDSRSDANYYYEYKINPHAEIAKYILEVIKN
jgi:hypothetical protein